MKKCVIIFLLMSQVTLAQEALHNFGNLKIHDTGAVGFHYDFINDGISDDNKGLVGFYSNENIIISGAFKPIFEDLEIVVANNLFLEVSVGVTNNTNFVLGNVITPRSLVDINLEYIDNAFYNGETNLTKVDGYAGISNKTNFTFPIGYNDVLRPLGIESSASLTTAKSAYFFENPNASLTFTESFDTEKRSDILTTVSETEFWDVDAAIPSKIRLIWDQDSQVQNLVQAIENLRVVGWHTENERWENLGNTLHSGNLSAGIITSDFFIPDNYTVVTLGGSLDKNNITLDNYLISANNDGINDFLVIKEVALSPNNLLNIYNRWGRAVYIEENYANLFEGKANTNTFASKNKILPPGVYFYTIELYDIDFVHQGYLYINE